MENVFLYYCHFLSYLCSNFLLMCPKIADYCSKDLCILDPELTHRHLVVDDSP